MAVRGVDHRADPPVWASRSNSSFWQRGDFGVYALISYWRSQRSKCNMDRQMLSSSEMAPILRAVVAVPKLFILIVYVL